MTSTKNRRLSSGFGLSNSKCPRWATSIIGSLSITSFLRPPSFLHRVLPSSAILLQQRSVILLPAAVGEGRCESEAAEVSHRDLSSHLDHPAGRNLEIVGRIVRSAGKTDE